MAAKTPEERHKKVPPGKIQRLADFETALRAMHDDDERRAAFVYFAPQYNLRCEPADKFVPGTDLRVGELP